MTSMEKRLVRASCLILLAAAALLAVILLWSPASRAENQVDESVNSQVSITIDTNFPGLLVGYDSTPLAPAPVSFQADVGSVHMLITKSPQPDSPADTRYRFDRWRGGPPTLAWNITATGNTTYFADFVRQYLIIIMSNIPGPQMNIDIGDCTPVPPSQGPISCWEDEGSNPTLIVNSPQVIDGCRYVFLGWADGNPQPARPIGPIAGPGTYIAIWTSDCYLTMAMDSSCQGTVMPLSGWYPRGTVVPIDWTPPTGLPPDERYRFKMWLGTGVGNYTGPAVTSSVTINGAITETAFCYHEYRIEVSHCIPGLYIEIDGLIWISPSIFWWEDMTIHALNASTIAYDLGTTRFVFAHWSDGFPDPFRQATILGPAVYLAVGMDPESHRTSLYASTNTR